SVLSLTVYFSRSIYLNSSLKGLRFGAALASGFIIVPRSLAFVNHLFCYCFYQPQLQARLTTFARLK
ncbi:MAG TPA: hypothetical protein VHT96_09480, partial [Clostridia bacterium]|nr:hypothetical protein [Clostridia bacterium]